MKYRRFGKAKRCYYEFGQCCNKDHPLGSRCTAGMTGRYFEVDPHQPPIEPCVKHLSYFLKNYEEVKREQDYVICHRCGSQNVGMFHVCAKTDKEQLRIQRIIDADFEGQPTGVMVVFAMVALVVLVAFGWWIRGCSS